MYFLVTDFGSNIVSKSSLSPLGCTTYFLVTDFGANIVIKSSPVSTGMHDILSGDQFRVEYNQ
jgi:hypothetical protein